MNWVSIIAVIFSGIGVGVSIWAIIVAKKSNKAVLKQNLEKELADINKDLADIEVQIQRAAAEGEEQRRTIYGIHSNPRIREIQALRNKRDTLLKRKQEIIQQL